MPPQKLIRAVVQRKDNFDTYRKLRTLAGKKGNAVKGMDAAKSVY